MIYSYNNHIMFLNSNATLLCLYSPLIYKLYKLYNLYVNSRKEKKGTALHRRSNSPQPGTRLVHACHTSLQQPTCLTRQTCCSFTSSVFLIREEPNTPRLSVLATRESRMVKPAYPKISTAHQKIDIARPAHSFGYLYTRSSNPSNT